VCLTIPGKIESISKGRAKVSYADKTTEVNLGVILDARVGDWVLYAGDMAVKKISAQDAKEIIELLEDNYSLVDVAALPLRYKRIVYKIRNTTSTESIHRKGTEKPITDNRSLITKKDIEYLFSLKGKQNLEALYAEANVMRKETLKDFVCIHGIIEFSNNCKNDCLYCGIRRSNENIRRYRMKSAEIFETAKGAVEKDGYKLLVLQSGEDDGYTDLQLLNILKNIKSKLRVFIFLSVGERSRKFYKEARKYASGSLYRFETSNPELYKKMHPGKSLEERLDLLNYQISLGYYMASGGLIGLPGQTISDLADDILLVKKLGIPMLSSGPFISAANTPLENPKSEIRNPKQSLNSKFLILNSSQRLDLTLKYIAIARLVIPEIKIPITTALETLDPENGRHKGLLAGGNALMFNLTPKKYSGDYSIYDNKYVEREKVWQKYGLFKGEESYEMLEGRLEL